jgi:predicted heme/steroid binding protein
MNTSSSFLGSESPLTPLPEYTVRQLAVRNGIDRSEIWVAFEGVIYDVSESRLWRAGRHYQHWAGQDLTAELADAPHTDRVFARFRAVGRLVDAS